MRACVVGEAVSASFTSVFLTQSLNLTVHPRCLSAYRNLPYDAYCQSVQSVLLRRTCNKCGLYHASLSSLKAHTRYCGVQQVIRRVRPVRVAARRQRELMAVIAYESAEDVEWFDEDDLDMTDVPVTEPDNDSGGQISVTTTDEHLSSPWTEV